ncbi:hypothetical protein BaRGS_00025215 [Batillaria attramentaria]|uniref:Uncharacterized protein n=1 Tax=Batillaria attramentaria TaxID=370345 RepID=A0ABD0K8X3_9CAEN
MTVYMPPIDRKKTVQGRYNPDTFRVISAQAEESHPKYEPKPYRKSFEPPMSQERLFPDIARPRTHVLPHQLPDHRANHPHSRNIGFICTDVRLLNEPVCAVYSEETRSVQDQWWPSRPNPGSLKKPEYARDTHYRNDYDYSKERAPPPSFRHSANPHTSPTRGIAPVNFLREKDGSQRFYREGLSYEHQYNCRADPNYPIRGKRHGALVWDRMNQQDTQKFIDYHTRLDREEMTASDKQPSPKPQQSQPEVTPQRSQDTISSAQPQSSASGVTGVSEPATMSPPQQPSPPTEAKEE